MSPHGVSWHCKPPCSVLLAHQGLDTGQVCFPPTANLSLSDCASGTRLSYAHNKNHSVSGVTAERQSWSPTVQLLLLMWLVSGHVLVASRYSYRLRTYSVECPDLMRMMMHYSTANSAISWLLGVWIGRDVAANQAQVSPSSAVTAQ